MTTLTPHRLCAPVIPYSLPELEHAADHHNCNCGPSALATMCCINPSAACDVIRDFSTKGYTNPTMMKNALADLRVPWKDSRVVSGTSDAKVLAQYGLNRIQWLGPWMNPGVPIGARYRKTHWVGSYKVNNDWMAVFDINCGWENQWKWERDTIPELMALYKGCTGWEIAQRWELWP